MEQDFNVIFNCFISCGLCLLLSTVYLASLHIWNSPYDRNHPSTIKKRFLSVFVMLFIAPYFLYFGLDKRVLEKTSLFEILGLRLDGLCQSVVLPLVLTVLLFLGPISLEIYSGLSKVYTGLEQTYWLSNLKNLIWIRNIVAAPFSEEFTYRCCMLPLLLQCFKPTTAVLINPLFFGLAHLHHLYERIRFGMDVNLAVKASCFQFLFTTIFGMYSAYLFLRTRHFASIFVVHSFCNHMGFPDILEINSYKRNKQIVFISLFVLGIVLWTVLLKPLTEPSWYYNAEPWHEML